MALSAAVTSKAQRGVARRFSRPALFLILAGLAFCAFAAADDLPAPESPLANVEEAEVGFAEGERDPEVLQEVEPEAALSAPEQAADKAHVPVGKIVAVGALIAVALLLLKSLYGKVSRLWG
ncbi:hypothetical protein ACSSS7_005940 [Eimeria intestinalis]